MFGYVRILCYESRHMRRRPSEIRERFFRGDYRDVLALGLAGRGTPISDEDFPYLVGALGFNGRKEEAESLFVQRTRNLSFEARVASRFFLGISHARHGDYARARPYLAINLREGRRHPNQRVLFFAMQGLGFYRYISSRFSAARKASEAAYATRDRVGFWLRNGFGG